MNDKKKPDRPLRLVPVDPLRKAIEDIYEAGGSVLGPPDGCHFVRAYDPLETGPEDLVTLCGLSLETPADWPEDESYLDSPVHTAHPAAVSCETCGALLAAATVEPKLPPGWSRLRVPDVARCPHGSEVGCCSECM